ncbi:MAG: hypothetical protein ABW215_09405 [Kibdelosporangium sp.]
MLPLMAGHDPDGSRAEDGWVTPDLPEPARSTGLQLRAVARWVSVLQHQGGVARQRVSYELQARLPGYPPLPLRGWVTAYQLTTDAAGSGRGFRRRHERVWYAPPAVEFGHRLPPAEMDPEQGQQLVDEIRALVRRSSSGGRVEGVHAAAFTGQFADPAYAADLAVKLDTVFREGATPHRALTPADVAVLSHLIVGGELQLPLVVRAGSVTHVAGIVIDGWLGDVADGLRLPGDVREFSGALRLRVQLRSRQALESREHRLVASRRYQDVDPVRLELGLRFMVPLADLWSTPQTVTHLEQVLPEGVLPEPPAITALGAGRDTLTEVRFRFPRDVHGLPSVAAEVLANAAMEPTPDDGETAARLYQALAAEALSARGTLAEPVVVDELRIGPQTGRVGVVLTPVSVTELAVVGDQVHVSADLRAVVVAEIDSEEGDESSWRAGATVRIQGADTWVDRRQLAALRDLVAAQPTSAPVAPLGLYEVESQPPLTADRVWSRGGVDLPGRIDLRHRVPMLRSVLADAVGPEEAARMLPADVDLPLDLALNDLVDAAGNGGALIPLPHTGQPGTAIRLTAQLDGTPQFTGSRPEGLASDMDGPDGVPRTEFDAWLKIGLGVEHGSLDRGPVTDPSDPTARPARRREVARDELLLPVQLRRKVSESLPYPRHNESGGGFGTIRSARILPEREQSRASVDEWRGELSADVTRVEHFYAPVDQLRAATARALVEAGVTPTPEIADAIDTQLTSAALKDLTLMGLGALQLQLPPSAGHDIEIHVRLDQDSRFGSVALDRASQTRSVGAEFRIIAVSHDDDESHGAVSIGVDDAYLVEIANTDGLSRALLDAARDIEQAATEWASADRALRAAQLAGRPLFAQAQADVAQREFWHAHVAYQRELSRARAREQVPVAVVHRDEPLDNLVGSLAEVVWAQEGTDARRPVVHLAGHVADTRPMAELLRDSLNAVLGEDAGNIEIDVMAGHKRQPREQVAVHVTGAEVRPRPRPRSAQPGSTAQPSILQPPIFQPPITQEAAGRPGIVRPTAELAESIADEATDRLLGTEVPAGTIVLLPLPGDVADDLLEVAVVKPTDTVRRTSDLSLTGDPVIGARAPVITHTRDRSWHAQELADQVDIPHIAHAVAAGDQPPTDPDFRAAIESVARAESDALTVVWTGIPRSAFENPTPAVREFEDWAARNGIVVVPIDAFQRDLVQSMDYTDALAERTHEGVQRATRIAALTILRRFGGLYVNGRHRRDHVRWPITAAARSREGYVIQRDDVSTDDIAAIAAPAGHPMLDILLEHATQPGGGLDDALRDIGANEPPALPGRGQPVGSGGPFRRQEGFIGLAEREATVSLVTDLARTFNRQVSRDGGRLDLAAAAEAARVHAEPEFVLDAALAVVAGDARTRNAVRSVVIRQPEGGRLAPVDLVRKWFEPTSAEPARPTDLPALMVAEPQPDPVPPNLSAGAIVDLLRDSIEWQAGTLNLLLAEPYVNASADPATTWKRVLDRLILAPGAAQIDAVLDTRFDGPGLVHRVALPESARGLLTFTGEWSESGRYSARLAGDVAVDRRRWSTRFSWGSTDEFDEDAVRATARWLAAEAVRDPVKPPRLVVSGVAGDAQPGEADSLGMRRADTVARVLRDLVTAELRLAGAPAEISAADLVPDALVGSAGRGDARRARNDRARVDLFVSRPVSEPTSADTDPRSALLPARLRGTSPDFALTVTAGQFNGVVFSRSGQEADQAFYDSLAAQVLLHVAQDAGPVPVTLRAVGGGQGTILNQARSQLNALVGARARMLAPGHSVDIASMLAVSQLRTDLVPVQLDLRAADFDTSRLGSVRGAEVLADEHWSRDPARTADWMTPLPGRATQQEIAAGRDYADVATVRTSVYRRRPTGGVVRQEIAYDVRRFETERGVPVQEYTVRLYLHRDESGVSDWDVQEVMDDTIVGVDRMFNAGLRVPSGEQLHLRVVFVDKPENAHAVITLSTSGRTTASHWNIRTALPNTLVHEVGHRVIDLGDEYGTETVPDRNKLPLFQQHQPGSRHRMPGGRAGMERLTRVMHAGLYSREEASPFATVHPRHLWHMERLMRAQVVPPWTDHATVTRRRQTGIQVVDPVLTEVPDRPSHIGPPADLEDLEVVPLLQRVQNYEAPTELPSGTDATMPLLHDEGDSLDFTLDPMLLAATAEYVISHDVDDGPNGVAGRLVRSMRNRAQLRPAGPLGPDLFPVVRPEPPVFLRNRTLADYRQGLFNQLFNLIDLTEPEPAPDALNPALMYNSGKDTAFHRVDANNRLSWAANAAVALPDVLFVPRVRHTIQLGGPLRDPAVMDNLAQIARVTTAPFNPRSKVIIVLWTDVSRERIDEVMAAPDVTLDEESQALRNMVLWAKRWQIRLVSLREVLHSGYGGPLGDEFWREHARGPAVGYESSSHLLMLILAAEVGGAFVDGREPTDAAPSFDDVAAGTTGFDLHGHGLPDVTVATDHPWLRLRVSEVADMRARPQSVLFPDTVLSMPDNPSGPVEPVTVPQYRISEVDGTTAMALPFDLGELENRLAGSSTGLPALPRLRFSNQDGAPVPVVDSLTDAVVSALVHSLYNRAGDLDFDSLLPHVSRSPDAQHVWNAAMGFIASVPQLRDRVRSITVQRDPTRSYAQQLSFLARFTTIDGVSVRTRTGELRVPVTLLATDDNGEPVGPTSAAERRDDDSARALQAMLEATAAPVPADPGPLGDDPFGLRQPRPVPAFLANVDQDALDADQVSMFLTVLSLTVPPLEHAPSASQFAHQPSTVTSRRRTDDERTSWAPGENLPALPSLLEIPHVLHAIWLGGPLANELFLARFGAAARTARLNGFQPVLWTDVRRDELASAAAGEVARTDDPRGHRIRATVKWAKDNGVALVDYQEVFHAGAPMRLQAEFATEMAKGVPAGFAAASDILRLGVLDRFGGFYSDGDNIVHHLRLDKVIGSRAGIGLLVQPGLGVVNSAMIVPRGHPFPNIYLDEIAGQYAKPHEQVVPPAAWPLQDRVVDQRKAQRPVYRNAVMFRTGPDVLAARVSGRLGHGFGFALADASLRIEGITVGGALSWLKPPDPRQPIPESDAAATLALTQQVATALSRSVADRDGDLDVAELADVLDQHERGDIVLSAAIGFLAGRAGIRSITRHRFDPFTIGWRSVDLPPGVRRLFERTGRSQWRATAEIREQVRLRTGPGELESILPTRSVLVDHPLDSPLLSESTRLELTSFTTELAESIVERGLDGHAPPAVTIVGNGDRATAVTTAFTGALERELHRLGDPSPAVTARRVMRRAGVPGTAETDAWAGPTVVFITAAETRDPDTARARMVQTAWEFFTNQLSAVPGTGGPAVDLDSGPRLGPDSEGVAPVPDPRPFSGTAPRRGMNLGMDVMPEFGFERTPIDQNIDQWLPPDADLDQWLPPDMDLDQWLPQGQVAPDVDLGQWLPRDQVAPDVDLGQWLPQDQLPPDTDQDPVSHLDLGRTAGGTDAATGPGPGTWLGLEMMPESEPQQDEWPALERGLGSSAATTDDENEDDEDEDDEDEDEDDDIESQPSTSGSGTFPPGALVDSEINWRTIDTTTAGIGPAESALLTSVEFAHGSRTGMVPTSMDPPALPDVESGLLWLVSVAAERIAAGQPLPVLSFEGVAGDAPVDDAGDWAHDRAVHVREYHLQLLQRGFDAQGVRLDPALLLPPDGVRSAGRGDPVHGPVALVRVHVHMAGQLPPSADHDVDEPSTGPNAGSGVVDREARRAEWMWPHLVPAMSTRESGLIHEARAKSDRIAGELGDVERGRNLPDWLDHTTSEEEWLRRRAEELSNELLAAEQLEEDLLAQFAVRPERKDARTRLSERLAAAWRTDPVSQVRSPSVAGQPIAYDWQRVEDAEFGPVQMYEVRLRLDPDADVTPTEVDQVRQRAGLAIMRTFNPGYGLPSGDRFRVRLLFTDRDEHATVRVSRTGPTGPDTWPLDGEGIDMARAFGGFLGLTRLPEVAGTFAPGPNAVMAGRLVPGDLRQVERTMWQLTSTASSAQDDQAETAAGPVEYLGRAVLPDAEDEENAQYVVLPPRPTHGPPSAAPGHDPSPSVYSRPTADPSPSVYPATAGTDSPFADLYDHYAGDEGAASPVPDQVRTVLTYKTGKWKLDEAGSDNLRAIAEQIAARVNRHLEDPSVPLPVVTLVGVSPDAESGMVTELTEARMNGIRASLDPEILSLVNADNFRTASLFPPGSQRSEGRGLPRSGRRDGRVEVTARFDGRPLSPLPAPDLGLVQVDDPERAPQPDLTFTVDAGDQFSYGARRLQQLMEQITHSSLIKFHRGEALQVTIRGWLGSTSEQEQVRRFLEGRLDPTTLGSVDLLLDQRNYADVGNVEVWVDWWLGPPADSQRRQPAELAALRAAKETGTTAPMRPKDKDAVAKILGDEVWRHRPGALTDREGRRANWMVPMVDLFDEPAARRVRWHTARQDSRDLTEQLNVVEKRYKIATDADEKRELRDQADTLATRLRESEENEDQILDAMYSDGGSRNYLPRWAAEVEKARQFAEPVRVDVDLADINTDSRITIEDDGRKKRATLRGPVGLVRFDVRRFEPRRGQPVTEATVRFKLKAGIGVTDADLETVRQKTLAAVDMLFNRKFRLVSGDVFWVRVEFVDQDAHSEISVVHTGKMAQRRWVVDERQAYFGHEVFHFLFGDDEYEQRVVFNQKVEMTVLVGGEERVLRTRADRVATDGLMTTSKNNPDYERIFPRHLWLFEKRLSAVAYPKLAAYGEIEKKRFSLPPDTPLMSPTWSLPPSSPAPFGNTQDQRELGRADWETLSDAQGAALGFSWRVDSGDRATDQAWASAWQDRDVVVGPKDVRPAPWARRDPVTFFVVDAEDGHILVLKPSGPPSRLGGAAFAKLVHEHDVLPPSGDIVLLAPNGGLYPGSAARDFAAELGRLGGSHVVHAATATTTLENGRLRLTGGMWLRFDSADVDAEQFGPPLSDLSVLTDKQRWQHSIETSAEWFDPVDPVSPAAVERVRRKAASYTVFYEDRRVHLDTGLHHVPRPSAVNGLRAFDVRAFEVDGKLVWEHTIRLFLEPAQGVDAEGMPAAIRSAVNEYFNTGFRLPLPGNPQFVLRVEFADLPTDAHAVVAVVPAGQRAHQFALPVDAQPRVIAHEIGHFALDDEHRTDVALSWAMETGLYADGEGGMMPRYAWQLAHFVQSQVTPSPLLEADAATAADLPDPVLDPALFPYRHREEFEPNRMPLSNPDASLGRVAEERYDDWQVQRVDFQVSSTDLDPGGLGQIDEIARTAATMLAADPAGHLVLRVVGYADEVTDHHVVAERARARAESVLGELRTRLTAAVVARGLPNPGRLVDRVLGPEGEDRADFQSPPAVQREVRYRERRVAPTMAAVMVFFETTPPPHADELMTTEPSGFLLTIPDLLNRTRSNKLDEMATYLARWVLESPELAAVPRNAAVSYAGNRATPPAIPNFALVSHVRVELQARIEHILVGAGHPQPAMTSRQLVIGTEAAGALDRTGLVQVTIQPMTVRQMFEWRLARFVAPTRHLHLTDQETANLLAGLPHVESRLEHTLDNEDVRRALHQVDDSLHLLDPDSLRTVRHAVHQALLFSSMTVMPGPDARREETPAVEALSPARLAAFLGGVADELGTLKAAIIARGQALEGLEQLSPEQHWSVRAAQVALLQIPPALRRTVTEDWLLRAMIDAGDVSNLLWATVDRTPTIFRQGSEIAAREYLMRLHMPNPVVLLAVGEHLRAEVQRRAATGTALPLRQQQVRAELLAQSQDILARTRTELAHALMVGSPDRKHSYRVAKDLSEVIQTLGIVLDRGDSDRRPDAARYTHDETPFTAELVRLGLDANHYPDAAQPAVRTEAGRQNFMRWLQSRGPIMVFVAGEASVLSAHRNADESAVMDWWLTLTPPHPGDRVTFPASDLHKWLRQGNTPA